MGLLTDQVAVLTGGGRGIGRAIALAMAAEGAHVVVADSYRDADGSAADQVAAEISKAGRAATPVETDVASEAGVAAMFEAAGGKHGRVDIVCTFAGNYIPKAFDTMTVSELASLLNVHVEGTFRAIQAAYSYMQPAGYGRIVTVASRGAFPHSADARDVPADKRVTLSSGYSAAKAAIVGLTAAVATDLAGRPEDITVSCLLPSANTQLFPGSVPRTAAGIPGAANLNPSALAPLVLYMASAEGRALNGRFLYGGGGDIALLPPPLRATEGTTMLRHADVWRVGDISEVLGPMVSARE